MKKIIALLLAIVSTIAMVGCSPDSGSGSGSGGNRPSDVIDPTKTQLYVSNYDGGYGTDWLYAVKDRFEELYAEESFQSGKTGVQIIVHADKDGYAGSGLKDKMPVTSDEVFFSEHIMFNDYVSLGYMLDVSDVVTGTNFDGKTIESKMSQEQQSSLKIGGKYYCVPHYASITGINYDIDLFDTKKLFYAKNGAPSEAGYVGTAQYTNLKGQRSAGPDGEYGTFDDGLPATYDEFFALCGYMKNAMGITPFCWTGGYRTTYVSWILGALAADYEGKEQMMLNYEFDGTAKNLVTTTATGIQFDAQDTSISNSNGYELYRSAGRYYALSFLERLLDNDYYHSCGFTDASQITAQDNFLRSSYQNKPIAMILEGIWWENEASATFKTMANRYGQKWAMENRRFGLMPLPKATEEQIGEKFTLIDNNYSYAFIRKNISPDKIDLAKLFLKFCYTDQSLQEFTTIVGLPKALTYSMPTDTKWKSAYSKSVWELYANADKIYPISQNPLYLSSQSSFVYFSTFRTSLESSALDYLRTKSNTALDFFKGIVSANTQTVWEASYSRFF